MSADPAKAWQQALVEGGYEHRCRSSAEYRKIARFGQAWRRILRRTRLAAPADAFEIGCGGGVHLAALAANGFSVTGIDASPDVCGRARRYLAEVSQFSERPLNWEVIEGDFFDLAPSPQYDLVFHFGVVEHYLEADRRRRFWDRAVAFLRPGGYVVSVVPCGRHLMRTAMRERELLGYSRRVPEIDYSAALHRDEFADAGLERIVVLPHAFFFFLSGSDSRAVRKLLYPAIFSVANVLLPAIPGAAGATERFAQTLIAIGRKPAGTVV